MKIADNCVALFNYTLKNDQGELLDSSEGNPMGYLHGQYNIVEGLEKELEGKQAGDKFEVTVEPAEAYGEFDDSLVQAVPRADFGDHPVEVGSQFHADTAIGPRVVTVTAIHENEVVIDANHELAGENLHFAIEVVEVREATAEEKEHGHIHAEGGCGHDHSEGCCDH
ncbi:FKBP-type peptidyl-prolyl cis-trans isomerase [Spongorhabdus nitratireducens]